MKKTHSNLHTEEKGRENSGRFGDNNRPTLVKNYRQTQLQSRSSILNYSFFSKFVTKKDIFKTLLSF